MIAKIFALLSLITVGISGLPFTLNKDNSSLLSEDGLFEGDLKINESLIRENYNMSSIEEPEKGSNRSRRAATANDVFLWKYRIVPYVISSSFSNSQQNIIRNAIRRWSGTTCLRFVTRTNHRDYIYFQSTDRGCYSYLGKQGGRQAINLQKPGCVTHGIVLHEIGHAIGFWHEQSRPDRDSYVRINLNNIESGQSHNFLKRTASEINSQGSTYDYESIMHYGDTAFVKDNCYGCKTIEVSNYWAYIAQGSPTLGQRNDLSRSDIQQANSLYSCPYKTLNVKVRYGRNLKDTDGWWNLSDPYVKIVAVDTNGRRYTKRTSTKQGTLNPSWHQTLRFGRGNWRFFQIRIWDDDVFWDDAMSSTETVVVKQGYHYNQKHCDSNSCSGYIVYDYSLV